jgi:hypothetical protein
VLSESQFQVSRYFSLLIIVIATVVGSAWFLVDVFCRWLSQCLRRGRTSSDSCGAVAYRSRHRPPDGTFFYKPDTIKPIMQS